jgi:hypothetical protein
MSIEGKHSYRFVYLKSEQWKTVRLEALVREGGRCQICGEESISNDAHHIWYPENIYETTEANLVILCRACHDFTHAMLPECKTKNEEEGRALWLRFFNAVKVWRASKIQCFQTGIEGGPTELRAAYLALKSKEKRHLASARSLPPEDIIRVIRDWAEVWKKHLPVDNVAHSIVESSQSEQLSECRNRDSQPGHFPPEN